MTPYVGSEASQTNCDSKLRFEHSVCSDEPTFIFHTNGFRVAVNPQLFKMLSEIREQYRLRSNFLIFEKKQSIM